MSKKYKLVITNKFRKDLRRIDLQARESILKALDKISKDPQAATEKVKTAKIGKWRYRVGDYRIRYDILEEEALIVVEHARHRKDVYK